MQNNSNSLDETSHSDQSGTAGCSDSVPIECTEPPQDTAQHPLGLLVVEVPENCESQNTEEHSTEAGRASNPTECNVSQTIRDDNRLHQFTDRFATFSCWPFQIPQHRDNMALAGFFYTGQGDRVCCAFCNLELGQWTTDDDPFSRHMLRNPKCPFIQEIRHREKWPTSNMTITSLIDKEEVKKVLEYGINWIDVERAVAKLLTCRCTDEITALEILKYLFQNETENEIQHVPKMVSCMVCRQEDPSILFLPCCHVCCCHRCGEQCYWCIFCYNLIKARVKIYIS